MQRLRLVVRMLRTAVGKNDTELPEGAGIWDVAAQLSDMPEFWNKKGFPMVDKPEVALGGGRSIFLPK